ncbi:MAG: diacylglycerol kinase [Nitrospirae bacterium]|nr:diacylglycerol kinase [Nitrospirota bacterium]
MPLRKFFDSTNNAINGIFHAAKTQRHMRYHLVAALLLLILSLMLGIGFVEFIVIVIMASVVLSVEMVNTAVESIIDVLFRDYDERARAIKDVAAGAVLIIALGAFIVGYMILLGPLKNLFYDGITAAKHSGEGIAFTSVVVVLILVIITKSFFGRGLPLRGGMPSGHAALSFSIWIAVTLLTESFMSSGFVLFLAILVAQSRVSVGIHSPWEVVLGALLGTAVTFFMFKVFMM